MGSARRTPVWLRIAAYLNCGKYGAFIVNTSSSSGCAVGVAHQQVGDQRQQPAAAIAVHRRLDGQAFVGFHLLRQGLHRLRQRAEGQRVRALSINDTVDFYHSIVRQAMDSAAVCGVDH